MTEKTDKTLRICPYSGDKFTPRHAWQTYCCKQCEIAHKRQLAAEPDKAA